MGASLSPQLRLIQPPRSKHSHSTLETASKRIGILFFARSSKVHPMTNWICNSKLPTTRADLKSPTVLVMGLSQTLNLQSVLKSESQQNWGLSSIWPNGRILQLEMAQKSIGPLIVSRGISPVLLKFDKEILKQMSPSILLTVDLSNSFLFDFAGFTTSNPLCSKRSGTRSWASKALSPSGALIWSISAGSMH